MPETPVDRRSVDPLFCIQSPKAAATEGGTVFRGRPHWGSGTDASLTTRTCRRIRGQNTSSFCGFGLQTPNVLLDDISGMLEDCGMRPPKALHPHQRDLRNICQYPAKPHSMRIQTTCSAIHEIIGENGNVCSTQSQSCHAQIVAFRMQHQPQWVKTPTLTDRTVTRESCV